MWTYLRSLRFLRKAAHTVIGNGGKIIYPRQSKEVVYEAELGVVIKKRMKDVAPEAVAGLYPGLYLR